MKIQLRGIIAMVCLLITLSACSDRGGIAIFKKQSPHEAYGQRLKDAGLDRTAMGSRWLVKADEVIAKPLDVTIPYRETGYFAADKAGGTALRFTAKRGKKLSISITKKPLNINIYADLFEINGNETKRIAFADTTGKPLEYEIKRDGNYLLRLQPELLISGEYTLTITDGPSLGFPVSAVGKPHIGSFWGAGRDAGNRRHEGIDIFAPKGTPAIAAAAGTVNNVTNNNLGGKVIFFRPDGKDYTLYYAHLDSQLVQNGQTLKPGDTIGLVGNTGNARYTPSHLHFGIYTSGGAIDPLAFVDRKISEPAALTAALNNLNATVRTANTSNKIYNAPTDKGTFLIDVPKNTVLTVEAAASSWYKVHLPDGLNGYISSKGVTDINTLRTITLKNAQPLLDRPDTANAPGIRQLAAGNKVAILGAYKNYYLVKDNQETGWVTVNQ
ncbi:M23 family metallopeptidase [Mucilaginibacter sp. UR6-1]|uniref:M23 family metallopeptidase n=1 Tax=Mucilaginibacter sp. UR6-1 TaxID=1435643 RepID=UPI001E3577CC|nr:M23 family metallopeptidase [Mucilaginibacter sp. UR6-1]MCC8410044.1 M23 family metallopeptidase [Mucilaginibacter sp. UR6-1]